MTGPARILLVSADMGGGHNATARALEEEARALWPECEIRWVDTLDVMGPGVGPLFRRIYVVNVQTTPWLYEFFYGSLLRWRWFAASSKRFVGAWCGRRLQAVLDDYAPDLILSVYPLGSAGLEWLRRYRGVRVPTGAWVSDFAPHPFWVYRDLDLHLVMHETAIAPAHRAEPQASVEVCAPPVVSDFAPGDAVHARAAHGLRTDAFIALISTGAYGFGDVESGVDALLAAGPAVQVVVACGRNDRLHRALLAKGLPERRLRALGWVQDMPSWMRAADVVVTNAGGATSLEALACGIPVLMFDPIAAHGRANAELMAASGLALLCPTASELTSAVAGLIADPARRRAVADAIADHLRRHDLDSALRELAKQSHQSIGAAGAAEPYWQPRAQTLRAADAFFLHVETPRVAQQVGAVLILDAVDGAALATAAVADMLAERLPHLPTLRKVLHDRGRLRAPRWNVLAAVDPNQHLSGRELTAPEQLSEAIDDFFSAPLPRDRPLWGMQVVGGLAQGRSALLIKLQHALGDGISVLETLDGVLDSASPAVPSPPGRRRPALAASLRLAAAIPTGLWHLARAGRAPASPSAAGPCAPVRQTARRHLVLVHLPAAEIRRTAHRMRVRSSELAISVAAGALHRLLTDRGLPTEGLQQRATVPVSLREAKTRRATGSGWGNWTGAITADLPVGPMDEPVRLHAIQRELRRRSMHGQPEAAQLVLRLIGLLPFRLHGLLARRVYCADWFNLIVSYIPGRARPQAFAGAPVIHAYPVLPTAEGVGLSIGIMPWVGEVGFGITADVALVPDAERLADAVRETFAALTAHETARR